MGKIKIGSNRNFGLVFFIVFLILGLMNSKLLSPLNKLWVKFGMILGTIVAPVVMGAVFSSDTPIGLVMKIMGKDLLNKKYDTRKKTYWIKRDIPIGTMKRQF